MKFVRFATDVGIEADLTPMDLDCICRCAELNPDVTVWAMTRPGGFLSALVAQSFQFDKSDTERRVSISCTFSPRMLASMGEILSFQPEEETKEDHQFRRRLRQSFRDLELRLQNRLSEIREQR